MQHLDAEAELRKFFGSRVVQATKAGASSSSRRNAGALRSNLTRPQSTWWSASQREGLSIRTLTSSEVEEKHQTHGWEITDEKWWTVEYSRKYKSMTRAFMRTVMSGGKFDSVNCITGIFDTVFSQIRKVFMSFYISYRGMPTRYCNFRRSIVIEKVCLAYSLCRDLF